MSRVEASTEHHTEKGRLHQLVFCYCELSMYVTILLGIVCICWCLDLQARRNTHGQRVPSNMFPYRCNVFNKL